MQDDGSKWAAFTYAGELSSAAWGWNNHGVCFTLNAVYANEVNINGVGRNFVSRSILDAKSLDEAIQRVSIPNQATGHNINVIGLDERKIVTIETGEAGADPGKQVQAAHSVFAERGMSTKCAHDKFVCSRLV